MGAFGFLKKKKINQNSAPTVQKQVNATVADSVPQSTYVILSCNGAVRKRMLAYSDGEAMMAIRWHQALNAIFSQSTIFSPVLNLSKTQWIWLDDRVGFRCPAGMIVFGIDKYTDEQWPMAAEENQWNISLHMITDAPEQLCSEIVQAIQEIIKIKVYWEIENSVLFTLSLTHQQGYADWRKVVDENGVTTYVRNETDDFADEEIC